MGSDVAQLAEQVRRLERNARRQRWALWCALVVGLVFGSAELMAQALPRGLHIFAAGDPVLASEMNENFRLLAGRSVPAGTIVAFAGATPPQGWLVCDGSLINQSSYPELYALLGTAWGSEGRLPDLGSRFLRGADDGRPVGQYEEDALQDFSGTLRRVLADSVGGAPAEGAFSSTEVDGRVQTADGGGDSIADFTFSPSAGGARTASETRPRNAAVRFIIKT